ncbi:MAG TPA: hypothetical protein PLE25_04160 [Spirochaetales bacterium]|nr:hypothetical protein [Spirochaetales bacterium]
MRKVLTITLSIAILTASAASLSCSSALVERGLSTIVIQTSPPVGRSLSGGWTMGEETLPSFSSITVTVRGVGMDTVSGTFADPSGAISLTVRPGSGLSVSVSATPDWAATAVRYPDAQLPVLVSGYSGGAVIDAPANATVSATISLAPATTRIPVPNPSGNWQLGVVDSLYSQSLEMYQVSGLSSDTHFAFDKSGLLYASLPNGDVPGVGVFGTHLDTGPYDSIQFNPDYPVGSIALCSASNRIYSLCSVEIEGTFNYYFQFVDLDDETLTPYDVTLDTPYAFDEYIDCGTLAVDALGYLYVPAYESSTETYGILRFSVGEPSGGTATATPLAFATLEELGLGYYDAESAFWPLAVEDMAIVGGTLYVALSELNTQASLSGGILAGAAVCRGKIVALGMHPLQYLWEVGWRDDSDRRPESPDAPGLFAPRRFLAVAPKRLYLLDEGFYVDVSKYSSGTWYPFEDVDRIVAVDVEARSLSFGARGLTDGLVNYDSDPYSTYANC